MSELNCWPLLEALIQSQEMQTDNTVGQEWINIKLPLHNKSDAITDWRPPAPRDVGPRKKEQILL